METFDARNEIIMEIEMEKDEKSFWHLNLADKIVVQLKKMGFENLFREKRMSHQ
jgi:superfamily II DNA/RNA helicase